MSVNVVNLTTMVFINILIIINKGGVLLASNKKSNEAMTTGIVIGILIGLAPGLFADNLVIGIAIGIFVGVGIVFYRNKK